MHDEFLLGAGAGGYATTGAQKMCSVLGDHYHYWYSSLHDLVRRCIYNSRHHHRDHQHPPCHHDHELDQHDDPQPGHVDGDGPHHHHHHLLLRRALHLGGDDDARAPGPDDVHRVHRRDHDGDGALHRVHRGAHP